MGTRLGAFFVGLGLFCGLFLTGCDVVVDKSKSFTQLLNFMDATMLSEDALLTKYDFYLDNPPRDYLNFDATEEYVNFAFNDFKFYFDSFSDFFEDGNFVAKHREVIDKYYPDYRFFIKQYMEVLASFRNHLFLYFKFSDVPKNVLTREMQQVRVLSMRFYRLHTAFLSELLMKEYSTPMLNIQ